jgi:hypothetical protein
MLIIHDSIPYVNVWMQKYVKLCKYWRIEVYVERVVLVNLLLPSVIR